MKYIVYGTNFKNNVGEFCQRNISPFYFISYFRSDYLMEYDGKLIEGNAGDMLISEPKKVIYHGPRYEAAEGFVNDWIYIDGGEAMKNLLKKYPLPQNYPFNIGYNLSLARCIENIHREKSYALFGYNEKCDILLTDMIIDIYREYINKSKKASAFDRLSYAKGEMTKAYNKNWTLAEIASLTNYSVSRFCALYKEAFGLSPISDLIAVRIKNAKLLLLYSNMSVNEISDTVGFSSVYYFSKYFKEKTGVSPSAYRRLNIT